MTEKTLWDCLLVGSTIACLTDQDVRKARISIETLYRLAGESINLNKVEAPCYLVFDGKHRFVKTLDEALKLKSPYDIGEPDIISIEEFDII